MRAKGLRLFFGILFALAVAVVAARAQDSQAASSAQAKRMVIIDQDCAGPGGTDMQAILAIVQS
ncbi:MAG: hypothetical protein ACRD41_10780, partial [Candidatus Acidiferrales bacterium]